MMPPIHYYIMTEISLSLEDYHNAGLTPEETKAVIESIYDPYGVSKFRCRSSGINSNWCITTNTSRIERIEEIVFEIEIELDVALERHKKKFRDTY